MRPCIQQRIFGQCPRRHHAHDIATNHRFRATLLGFGGGFHLIADRDREPFAGELSEITFGGMGWDTAHGDIFAPMFAPLGQRNIQRSSGLHRILKK